MAELLLPVPFNTPSTPPCSPTTAAASGGDVLSHLLDGESVAYLHRSMSVLSLNRTAREEAESLTSSIEKVISICISGGTSSGKTTLAIILAEVFTSPGMAAPSFLGVAPSVEGNMVINQDIFFFNKGACEITSFPSKKEDRDFCRASLLEDQTHEYIISTEGSNEYRISGPDTDHISAVNFWGLLKTVEIVKREGSLPKLEALASSSAGVYGGAVVVRVKPEQINAIRTKYADLITQAKQVVSKWTNSQATKNKKCNFNGVVVKHPSPSSKPTISPKLLFLEGFLLFDPLGSSASTQVEDSDTEDEATALKKNFAYGRMGLTTEIEKQKGEDDLAQYWLTELEKKFQAGVDFTNAELEYIQEHHFQSITKAMKQLQQLMDIKLFLTASMQASKERRMRRGEYSDEPFGHRKPGQMWKTEGYFEHVAWKNHILQHKWLIDFKGDPLPTVVDGVGEAGVLVQEPVDASVEDTVKWALECILGKLNDMEECARNITSLEECVEVGEAAHVETKNIKLDADT